MREVKRHLQEEHDFAEGVLYKKAIEVLKKKATNGKVRFPDVKHTLSWLFHLNKKQSWELLKELELLGLVKIVPYRWILLVDKNALRESKT